MYNLGSKEAREIVDFIYESAVAHKQWLSKLTKDEIAVMLGEHIKSDSVRVVYEKGVVSGVVFFSSNRGGEFWCEQIWCRSKRALQCFLLQLKKEFPKVNIVRGWRKRSNKIKRFPVSRMNNLFLERKVVI